MPSPCLLQLEKHVRALVPCLGRRAGIAQPVVRAFVRSVVAVLTVGERKQTAAGEPPPLPELVGWWAAWPHGVIERVAAAPAVERIMNPRRVRDRARDFFMAGHRQPLMKLAHADPELHMLEATIKHKAHMLAAEARAHQMHWSLRTAIYIDANALLLRPPPGWIILQSDYKEP